MNATLRSLGIALILGTALPVLGTGCGDTTAGDEQNVTATTGRFEIIVGQDSQRYFQLIAANGEKVLRSEGYTSLSGCKNGIASVKKNGVSADNYEILEAVNGEFYFNLIAGNGQIIGTSETYVSRANAERAVDTVVNVVEGASTAEIDATGAKFETFTGVDGQEYFRLRAKNGQIILQSEGYTSSAGADNGIESVKTNGTDPDAYTIVEAQNGQHFFHIKAGNGEIIARGELYVSKYNAQRGAETVRKTIRDMTGEAASDDDIQTAIEDAADGLYYMSEGDYPFLYVHADLDNQEITEELVREKLAHYVDGDPDADKPLATLYGDSKTFSEWQSDPSECADVDQDQRDDCYKQSALDQVLADNLTDLQVFYFGAYGGPGYVDGVAVSIIIVGRTPAGNLAGVRTIAIWT